MLEFETFGNAILQFRRGEEALLTCDPWIEGAAYFGSWGIEAPLSERQKTNVIASKYLWISHGHPDHLHPDSLQLIPKEKTTVLIPDHYDRDVHDFLVGLGFKVQILRYKQWTELDPELKVLCLDNENQDAILVAKFGDALIVNQNDSPPCGETYFLKKLVRNHPNEKTILAALCAVDADMLNIVDERGDSLAGDPDLRKKGAVWVVASYAAQLGVKHFCCSSSQHVYLRKDSVWANPYRIGWDDMRQHWIRPEVALHEPYTTATVEPLRFVPNNPMVVDISKVADDARVDDWAERLTEDDWKAVAAYVSKLELIREKFDFVGFEVGGERRDFPMSAAGRAGHRAKGIVFSLPRAPLMDTVGSGYFDDLLIGNFMKTRLINTTLYPNFTPRVAKLAGNAKVYTQRQRMRFLWRYFRRNPRAFLASRAADWWDYRGLPAINAAAESVGIKPLLKTFYRKTLLGHPT